jgi:hypothetical protein
LLLAPVTHLALTGQAGLPQFLGWLTGVTLVEQVVESITIFGTHGFTEPGGPMNLQLGAGLTTVSLLAIGIVIAREPVPA